MRQLLFIILLVCCVAPPIFSQGEKYLALDKPGRVKRIRFYMGDELTFKLKGDKTMYSSTIEAVGDSTITIRETQIPIKDIALIKLPKEAGFINQAIYILPRAGILYFLADTFNPVFRGGSPDVSRSGIVVGGSFIAGGLILKLLNKRKFRINNYRSLRILETF
jgi:hypothetical protein